MSWTAEQNEFVKTKWAEGWSAADIAAEIGGVSRSAVLGKVHRMNLAARRGDKRKEITVRPYVPRQRLRKPNQQPMNEMFPFLARGKAAKEFARRVGVAELSPDQSLHAVTFEKLDSMHCRWMLGEPSEQLYCGEDHKPGSSYCHRHHAIAYTKPERGGEKKVWFDFRKRAA